MPSVVIPSAPRGALRSLELDYTLYSFVKNEEKMNARESIREREVPRHLTQILEIKEQARL